MGATLDRPEHVEGADAASAPWCGDVGSWERLAAATMAQLAGTSPATAPPAQPLYPHYDAAVLLHPLTGLLRGYRVALLHRLMSAVSVGTMTQEHVCTVNTALLMFVQAHRHRALPGLLSALVEHDAQSAHCPLPSLHDTARGHTSPAEPLPPASATTLGDFALLCGVWVEYYSLRDRDRRALITPSGYLYEQWRVVALALLGLVGAAPSDDDRGEVGVVPPPTEPLSGSGGSGLDVGTTVYLHPGHPVQPHPLTPDLAAAAASERAWHGAMVAQWLRAPRGYWAACALTAP
jgi:hypothetical protein